MGSNHEKNEGRKSRDTLQLNEPKDNTYVTVQCTSSISPAN